MSAEQADELLGHARNAAILLKALSHETRLMILCLLFDTEKSVSEIELATRLPQAAVSQQLARLRKDDLVSTRRDGRTIYYRLANDDVASIVETLHNIFCKSPSPPSPPSQEDQLKD